MRPASLANPRGFTERLILDAVDSRQALLNGVLVFSIGTGALKQSYVRRHPSAPSGSLHSIGATSDTEQTGKAFRHTVLLDEQACPRCPRAHPGEGWRLPALVSPQCTNSPLEGQ